MAVKNNSNSEGNYNILAYASILIIIISIFYLGFKVTGNATSTDTAVVNVTISSVTAINFTTDFINFGAGYVNTGEQNASMDTDGTVVRGTWTPISATNFTLENIGNTNVNLSIKMGKTAAQYLGGTNPLYQFKYSNRELGSCTNASATGTWTATSTSDIFICSNFTFADSNDTINIGVKLVIPSDSVTGQQTDTFTATATSL